MRTNGIMKGPARYTETPTDNTKLNLMIIRVIRNKQQSVDLEWNADVYLVRVFHEPVEYSTNRNSIEERAD